MNTNLLVFLLSVLFLLLLSGCAEELLTCKTDADCQADFVCMQDTLCTQSKPQKCISVNYCEESPQDTGPVCGDMTCEGEETGENCPIDCSPTTSDSCDELEEETNSLLEQANHCNVDSDCTILSGYDTCPSESADHHDCYFGCYPLLNKNTDTTTLNKIMENTQKYIFTLNCVGCSRAMQPPRPAAEDIKCMDNKCVISSSEVPPSEIKVTTSKTYYDKGETVWVRVLNSGSQPVTYNSGFGCGIALQRKVDGAWEFQYINSDAFRGGEFPPCVSVVIEPGEQIEFSRLIDSNPPAGTYRAVFSYTGESPARAYSNEFSIK